MNPFDYYTEVNSMDRTKPKWIHRDGIAQLPTRGDGIAEVYDALDSVRLNAVPVGNGGITVSRIDAEHLDKMRRRYELERECGA